MKRTFYLLFTVTLCIVLFSTYEIFLFSERPEKAIIPLPSKTIQHSKVPDTSSDIKTEIQFVGDVMLARNVEKLIRTYGIQYPYESLPPQSTNSFLVGNFEATIPKVHVPTKDQKFSFSVDPYFLKGLKEYGFTHLGLANNHSYDFGRDEYVNAFQELKIQGLQPFGDQQKQASSTIQFLKIKNKTIAIIGIFEVDEALTKKEVQSLFTRAKLTSDFQIAFVHWGTEYSLVHTAFQESFAHMLIDAGADAVVGHHPHVVEDIGMYKNAPIFYSLGNFIFDQYFSEDVEEGLKLTYSLSDQDVIWSLIPITSVGSRSQPRYMSSFERNSFLTKLAKKSDVSIQSMIEKGLIIVHK